MIVGAGPAGLFAAAEFARHGVRARIVERETSAHHQTRATAIQPAVLEVLGRAGILERFLAVGMPIRGVRFIGPELKEIAVGTFAGIGCDHEHQCSLPQWQTEQILLDHLESLGGHVERGVEVQAIDDLADGLRVALEHANSRIEETVVDYVIGAGGASSVTRSSMHSHLDGATYGGLFVAADARHGLPNRPEEAKIYLGPAGFVLMAPLPDERWIMFVNVAEGTTAAPNEGELALPVNERGAADRHMLDVSNRVHETVMGLVEAFASGQEPALPPPDAARELAAQRGRAMLDVSYAGSPLVREHGPADEAREPVVGARFPDRSKLSGTSHHLLVYDPVDLEGLQARWAGLIEVVDGSQAGFDPARAGVINGGVVLVRPDGMIGFRATPIDDAGIAALEAHLSSYLVPRSPSANASASQVSPVAAIG